MKFLTDFWRAILVSHYVIQIRQCNFLNLQTDWKVEKYGSSQSSPDITKILKSGFFKKILSMGNIQNTVKQSFVWKNTKEVFKINLLFTWSMNHSWNRLAKLKQILIYNLCTN